MKSGFCFVTKRLTSLATEQLRRGIKTLTRKLRQTAMEIACPKVLNSKFCLVYPLESGIASLDLCFISFKRK